MGDLTDRELAMLEQLNNLLKDVKFEYDDPNVAGIKTAKSIHWDDTTQEFMVKFEDGSWAHMPFLTISGF